MAKKQEKKAVKKKAESEDEDDSGSDLDDAFADDEDVEYAKAKPKKVGKKGMSEDELEDEIEELEDEFEGSNDSKGDYVVKASKPITKVKKGDKVLVDGKQYEVDAHYVLIDHGTTKEMALELFDSKTDKDYQLRYFSDQAEKTLEFYELQEIMFIKKPFSKISW